MKAIVCEQVEKFKFIDLPEPDLVPGEAIVGIRRIGICGSDLHTYKGNQPFLEYPRILGHELAGVIERIGPNEAGLSEGDQVSIIPYMHCGSCIACRNGKTNCCTTLKVLGVHIDGGMRERISVPVTHLIKTNGLTLDQSAVLEPLAIGAHAVRRSGLRQSDTALVIGGGPIGLGVMAFAKERGATVIVMDINEERLAFSKKWAKADHTINALQQPAKQLSAITNGDLPIVVFDATGNVKSMTDSFAYTAQGGTLVFVGLVKSDISFHDPEFHRRELTLMSSRNATKEDFDHVYETVAANKIEVEKYVTHRSSFDEMIAQFDGWLKPESKVIKAMVELKG